MASRIKLLLSFALFCCGCGQSFADSPSTVSPTERVVIESDGWELVGDLQLPLLNPPYPAVFLFNQAGGERSVYAELAEHLSKKGVASLRIDLRGHGESINLGKFVPGEIHPDPIIWDAEQDVIAALKFLSSDSRFDSTRFGFVGASYSGEEVAEASRLSGYGALYVMLSPGSFSESSIKGIDRSAAHWLFVTSRNDPFLKGITSAVWNESETLELSIIPGSSHATDMLSENPGLAERVAVWAAQRLH